MKKIQTLLMMFSLFFLFSFSYAGTVTINGDSYDCPEIADTVIDCEFEDYIFVKYNNAYYTGSYYQLYFLDSSNSSYSNLAILGKQASHVINDIQYYRYYFLKTTNGTNYSLISPQLTGYKLIAHSDNKYKFSNSFVIQNFDYELLAFGNNIEFLHCNYPAYNIEGTQNNWTLLDIEYEPSDKIVMENPLTDAEIKSILEIFLESVRNADLPDHYGRYVLTHNKVTGKCRGFVYPSYIDLGLEYFDFTEDGSITLIEKATGPYYRFSIYEEDENYFSMFFDALDLLIKKPVIYEFVSNSSNTAFIFNETHNLIGDVAPPINTVNEPIFYTSHKIYSLFFIDSEGFGSFEVDENTSINKQEFINPETGLPLDTTINEYTDEVSSNVNLLSFIKLLFEFIFSLVLFLIKFLTFIVSFIIVPASTTILPPEFVTGIDWIHSFAFGEILLWDIFSILFSVLLSIYIVKLIRSH